MNVSSRWGLAIALSIGLHVVVLLVLMMMGGSGTPPPPLPPPPSGVAEHVDTPSLDGGDVDDVGKGSDPVSTAPSQKVATTESPEAVERPRGTPKKSETKKPAPPKKPEAKKSETKAPEAPKKPEAKKPEAKAPEAPKKPEVKKPEPKLADDAGSEWKLYEVQPGDSLTKLAKKCGCTVQELAKVNGLKPTSNLNLGQKIKIK